MDWNKLQKRTFLDRLLNGIGESLDQDDEENEGGEGVGNTVQKLRSLINRKREEKRVVPRVEERGVEFFVTESVERQIELGENLLEIVFPDISRAV